MFYDVLFRKLPTNPLLKVLFFILRGFEVAAFTYFVLPAAMIFFVAPVSVYHSAVTAKFTRNPTRANGERWSKSLRRKVKTEQLFHTLYKDSERSFISAAGRHVTGVVGRNVGTVKYLLSDSQDPDTFLLSLEAATESLLELSGSPDANEEAGVILEAMHGSKDSIRLHMSELEIPDSEDRVALYTCYRASIDSYRNFVNSVEEGGFRTSSLYGDKIKEIYNAMFRPVFHMKYKYSGSEDVLIPTYYPLLDTFEGLLYEGFVNDFNPLRIDELTHEDVMRVAYERNPEMVDMPSEWVDKLAGAVVDELVQEYAESVPWKDDELKAAKLPYWSLSKVKAEGLVGIW